MGHIFLDEVSANSSLMVGGKIFVEVGRIPCIGTHVGTAGHPNSRLPAQCNTYPPHFKW